MPGRTRDRSSSPAAGPQQHRGRRPSRLHQHYGPQQDLRRQRCTANDSDDEVSSACSSDEEANDLDDPSDDVAPSWIEETGATDMDEDTPDDLDGGIALSVSLRNYPHHSHEARSSSSEPEVVPTRGRWIGRRRTAGTSHGGENNFSSQARPVPPSTPPTDPTSRTSSHVSDSTHRAAQANVPSPPESESATETDEHEGTEPDSDGWDWEEVVLFWRNVLVVRFAKVGRLGKPRACD